MTTCPLPQNEAERLTAVHACKILDAANEVEFDVTTLVAASLFNAPIALVSLMDRDRLWFKARFLSELRAQAGRLCSTPRVNAWFRAPPRAASAPFRFGMSCKLKVSPAASARFAARWLGLTPSPAKNQEFNPRLVASLARRPEGLAHG